MAFTGPNPATPYYRPVEPEVPKPDNTAANIISQGGQAGVQGFIRMATAARQAELEEQQMLQQADLQSKALLQKDKWQQMDYELDSRKLDMQAEMLPYAKRLSEAHAAHYSRGVTGFMDKNRQRLELLNEFGEDAKVLEDPKAWKDDPLGQAARVKALERDYAGTTDTGLKAAIKGYQQRANESQLALTEGDKTQFYAAAQVADDLSMNGFDSPFIPILESNGYIKTQTTTTQDGSEVISGYEILPKGKKFVEGTIKAAPLFQGARDRQSKLAPGAGKVLAKDMSDPSLAPADAAIPSTDLGVQPPPGSALPAPAAAPSMYDQAKRAIAAGKDTCCCS